MAKSRKRVFPKPVPRLTSKTAETLGKNSNKVCYEASLKGIYYSEKYNEDKLSPEQKKMLFNLKRNLSSTYQG